VSRIRTGFNRGCYLLKPGYSVVEESFIAFAEIAFAALLVANQTNSIFHAATSANIKVFAKEAFVGKILLSAGKGTLLTAGGEFIQRCLKNVAKPPFWLDKELTGEAIAGVLYNCLPKQ